MWRALIITISVLAVATLGGCNIGTAKSNIQKQHIGRMSLFVLAGQSNMSGRGILPETVASDERVYVFGNDYQWRLAMEPVDDATNQVDTVSRDGSAGYSPATSFAFALLEKDPGLVIGLIPCARSNSSIEEWQRDFDVDSLYGSCLKRVRTAAEVGDVAGLLFFQGETDAVDPDLDLVQGKSLHPEDWDWWFSQMVAAFREDLSAANLPVVFAQIAENWGPENFPNWEAVKEAQRSVKLPETSMIVTEDLSLQDGVHFTTDSYRKIGERFAEAMWNSLER